MWKVYFYIIGFFLLSGTLVAFAQHKETGLLVIPDLLITILAVIGMYSFSFHKKIWTKKFWQLVWWLSVVLQIIEMASRFFPNAFLRTLYAYHPIKPYSPEVSSISYLLVIPLFYMLYSLAFKDFKEKKQDEQKEKQPYSELAITSLVTGITGIFLPILLTIPSCILGILALQRIAKTNERGKGMAWFGISILFVQVILLCVFMVFAIVIAMQKDHKPDIPKPAAQPRMNAHVMKKIEQGLSDISLSSTSHDVYKLYGNPFAAINLNDNGSQFLYNCPVLPNDDKCVINVYYTNDDTAYKVTLEYADTVKYSRELHQSVQKI